MQPHIASSRSSVHVSQAWCIGLLRQRSLALKRFTAQASVTPPPPEFDYRAKVAGSLQFVKQHHPELTKLASEGRCAGLPVF